MPAVLPPEVQVALAAADAIDAVEVRENPLPAGIGAASGGLTRLDVTLRTSSGHTRHAHLVKKTLSPMVGGRHTDATTGTRHWAYWRREAEAYTSGLLPTGPGLRAVCCLGVDGNDVYLEDVVGPAPSVEQAALHLGAWQVDYDPTLDRPWLAQDQLTDRLAAADLDWGSVDADARVVEMWKDRRTTLQSLAMLPVVRSHGDYSLGNLVVQGAGTVALDWASFGWEPVGFDLAHLALSTAKDPWGPYFETAPRHREPETVDAGFATCAALIGASRVHWMLERGIDVPPWYIDFLSELRPSRG